jgi:hypothetical protein
MLDTVEMQVGHLWVNDLFLHVLVIAPIPFRFLVPQPQV